MNVHFDINGHQVREIRSVLASVGITEGTAYREVPFDPATRARGEHTFDFNDEQTAADAATTWQKHVERRAAFQR
ncbi:hypothetical protein [Rhizobium sp. NFR03]|uniref:hypothetical protein n=1 Tax=Rhizobium sp. NFR03 TaxID=1566263 RepID=UPI0008CC292E|nr:hypothetical protein [Rhizobium sp. NFR03]SES47454.1 hypothetical protein SAMN03159406_05003 [Rhizobium sp. NFR03]